MRLPNRSALSPLFFVCLAATACEPSAPPPGETTRTAQPIPLATQAAPTPVETAELPAPPASAAAEPEKPWEGPFLGVTRSSAGIYADIKRSKDAKLGYAQEGAKVPVEAGAIPSENCKQGWYRLASGGFICGDDGTLNLDDPRIKLGPRQPDLEAILPYKYARNAHNGTPLYRSVPSQEQIEEYEPWRFDKQDKPAEAAEPRGSTGPKAEKNAKATENAAELANRERANEEQARRLAALAAARRAMLGEAAAKKLAAEGADLSASVKNKPVPSNAEDAGAPPLEKKWWQHEEPELHELRIEDLEEQGSGPLARRMIKGFYIAVEKTFEWQGRNWYRSTKGYVAPTDRFHLTDGSDFKGVELGATRKLPIAWPYGHEASKTSYTFDAETQRFRPQGKVKRLEAQDLTGQEREVNKTTYLETTGGLWLRAKDVRVTRPGPMPAEVGPNERWIDVNLTTQTLVLFEGPVPIFATLISSGKESSVKDKDHRTPTGQWRIDNKHITATMDGDGTAAGDLPYSIEAVPYVMYFHKSYATHAAFWHRNYGTQMSHGCVNLAPLDAKTLFFNTEPPVPEGTHGAWSTETRPGSWVVVHR